ncbi:MAG TPA: hypothetical protein VG322_04685 [Candidatus Acidoferrales bacterium]|jgi:hypothetical protein|nr:hypothetical protein [Candidatus Acidoferrales bacterium]
MPDDAEIRLFEVVKSQDVVMHSVSAEMGVKTSLYLVFSAFYFAASMQVVNLVKGNPSPEAKTSITICAVGAALSLLGGIFLLSAAMRRDYKAFPTLKMANWIVAIKEFREKNPTLATSREPATEILNALVKTVDNNKRENELKASWVDRGAFCLFASVPFLAVGAAFALYCLF